MTPQSGLVVEIPESEPLVELFRLDLDQNARSVCRLPVQGTALTVSLLVQDENGHWSRPERFPLTTPDQQPDRHGDPA